MNILNWLRHRGSPADEAGKQAVAALAERATVPCPYVRLVPGYRKRLAPALTIAHRYLRDVVDGLKPPCVASEAAWSTDPYIHAFFGTAQDVMPVLSRSPDLRDYFGRSASVPEAFAVLGMEKQERRTLGVALEGDVMRTEVPQTTVSFGDHRVRICAGSDAMLRDRIAELMLDQLALQALAEVASVKSQRDRLERERMLLTTRLHLLEKQGIGMRRALGGDHDTDADDAARLREQVAENDAAIARLGTAHNRDGAPERQLRALVEVLSHAQASFSVERQHLRLSRLNVVLPPDSAEAGENLELMTARIPGDPPLVRTFALICVPRAGMLSQMQLLDEAARML